MFSPLTAALLGSQLVVAIADEIPHFDSEALCRDAPALTGANSCLNDEQAAPHFDPQPLCRDAPALTGANSCLKDEQDARDKLAKFWAQISPTDRTQCTQTAGIGGPGSYVKLLVCVEAASKPLKER